MSAVKEENRFFFCVCVGLSKFSCCENFHPLAGSGSSAYGPELRNSRSFGLTVFDSSKLRDFGFWRGNIKHVKGKSNVPLFLMKSSCCQRDGLASIVTLNLAEMEKQVAFLPSP